MLVKFTDDGMIFPPESAWFWQLQADETVLPVQETEFYEDDYIGLKSLDDQGKVQYVEFPGDHLHITADQITNIVVPFLLS